MTEPAPPRKASPAPIPSATVLVLRDAPGGLEVFMLVRNRQVDFASGALVFPGGKVDGRDQGAAWTDLAPVPSAHPTRDYWVAALRETFEETGLLLADHSDGRAIDHAEAAVLRSAHRTGVADASQAFADVLAKAQLRLATARLVPFAHWITPDGMPKRFDTHFFLAHAPLGQHAEHDGGETIESMWIRPADAVRDAQAGRRTLVPATELNLEKLAEAKTVAEAFARAKAAAIVPVMPTVARAEGGTLIRIPAGAGYARTEVLIKRANPA